MARGINKVILVGNVGQDPEVRFTPGGDAVATLSLATTDAWTDKQSGQRQERTEWHRVVLWRKMAEIAQQYVKKGSKLYIEGKLQTRKWQDQSGVDRYTTEIKAMDMQMLGGGQGQPQGAPQGQPVNPSPGATYAQGGGVHQGQAQRSPYADNPRGQGGNHGAPDPGSFDYFDYFDDEIPFDDAPGAGR